ncbi:hypothetical protein P7F88_12615 [Vibrio hannami]|uniref:hypothetical protein n=1 Tax=Vibrio hannami TaxID=2717094 RepID=UPI00240EB60D|nr:hypothetical protein [Vibrio hannami]MDG3086886.1 hypothetical protein [Vibrio hannami]
MEAVRSGTPAEDEAELNDVYAEIQDTRDALDEAVETKRPPQVVEAKAHRYEQAAKRLAG